MRCLLSISWEGHVREGSEDNSTLYFSRTAIFMIPDARLRGVRTEGLLRSASPFLYSLDTENKNC